MTLNGTNAAVQRDNLIPMPNVCTLIINKNTFFLANVYGISFAEDDKFLLVSNWATLKKSQSLWS